MNIDYSTKLEWINQEEFENFVDSLRKNDNSKPFEEWFVFKFKDGTSVKFRLLFNQENGFYFT